MNVLYISDKFLTYEMMHTTLETYLKRINIAVAPEVIYSKWPNVLFKQDRDISEYVDVDEALLYKIEGKDILLTHLAGIKAIHIKRADRLKVIGCVRSMPVNIDIKAAKEKGIALLYAPGRSTEAVAEFTLGLIINLRRKILIAQNKLNSGKWEDDFFSYSNASPAFDTQVVGIIGFGNIGRRVSELLKPFRCQILVYDPYVDETTINSYDAEKKAQLKELLQESDIVTIHARPPDMKKVLIGVKELSFMKPTSYIVNTARGYLVDYKALYSFLKAGRIAGAALDTYEVEPIPINHPILALENVIATPHIAGATRKTAECGLQMVCRGISEWILGHTPHNLFNYYPH